MTLNANASKSYTVVFSEKHTLLLPQELIQAKNTQTNKLPTPSSEIMIIARHHILSVIAFNLQNIYYKNTVNIYIFSSPTKQTNIHIYIIYK